MTLDTMSGFSSVAARRRKTTRTSARKTLPMALHPTTVRGSSQVESILLMHGGVHQQQQPKPKPRPQPRQQQGAIADGELQHRDHGSAAFAPRPVSSSSTRLGKLAPSRAEYSSRPLSSASTTSFASTTSAEEERADHGYAAGHAHRSAEVAGRPVLTRFASQVVDDQVGLMEAINRKRIDNERSTKLALRRSLAYLGRIIAQVHTNDHDRNAAQSALRTLEEASFDTDGTPSSFSAWYAQQNAKDQAAEIETLQAGKEAAEKRIASLEAANEALQARLDESRSACEEGALREEKQRQYVHRLRQDLMNSFDDLKAMEATKDSVAAMAKHRTLELAEIERKLQHAEKSAHTLKHNLETAHARLDDTVSQLAGIRRENAALWRYVEDPAQNALPSKSPATAIVAAHAGAPPP